MSTVFSDVSVGVDPEKVQPGSESLSRAEAALGNALFFNDQWDAADAQWRQALPAAEHHQQDGGSAWLEIRQGLIGIQVQRGDTAGGLANMLALQRALSQSPLRNGRVMAQFQNDLGDVYFQASREDEALKAFSQAVNYDQAHPQGPEARDMREQLLARSNRVFARWALCDLEGARQESAELREQLAQRLGQRHVLLLSQTRLGVMVANELARYDEALALLQNPARQQQLAANIRQLAYPRATATIVDELLRLLPARS